MGVRFGRLRGWACGWVSGVVLGWMATGLGLGQGLHVETHRARARAFLAGRQDGAAAMARARAERSTMVAGGLGGGAAASSILNAAWLPVGPGQVVTPSYGLVTGRVTSLVLDPADSSGDTLYVGTTGGGVWKSTNAAAAGGVQFTPLTDDLPVFSGNAGSTATASLSIGALAMSGGVLLAGTGDTNDATDSYYGSGILRSADGGVTWTLIEQAQGGAGAAHPFAGLGFAGIAFSGVNPQVVVAAVNDAAEGDLVNAASAAAGVKGLYVSQDAGVTWALATVYDGSQPEQLDGVTGTGAASNGATAVVWNAVRKRFYAAVVAHGYYESADGVLWTRMSNQPGTGLTAANCPTLPGKAGSLACPIFRGVLAVAATGDTFALTVDGANRDEGLFRDVCASTGTSCANASAIWGSQIGSSALDTAGVIAQGDYDLTLGTVASGTDTLLFVGTEDLFRCSLAAGCALRNTTNAANGCTNPAGVAPAQHAFAAAGTVVFVGTDGGVYRSSDGVAETGASCSTTDAVHWANLNGGLGSLAEVVGFAQDPVDTATLVAGLGALGTAGTGAAASPWAQVSAGEGGAVAIDPATPADWYVSTGAGVSLARCTKGTACEAADFAAVAIGEAQVLNDAAAVHAAWMLDPELTSDVLVGTCRVWRGPGLGGALWSSANELSRPFGAAGASACPATLPLVRTLGAGGAVSGASAAQSAGSEVLYAGLAGTLDGGGSLGGHVFTTASAQLASGTVVWTDAAKAPVTNDLADANVFNPGGFDVSSVVADAHDATGKTVYATVMGFTGNGVNVPRVYRSVDGGAHWLNVSSNLPGAPANALAVDPNDANTVYVATDAGVFVTTQISTCTTGNCWSVYGVSLPNAPVVGLQAAIGMATGDGRTGELRAATYGRGIWGIPLLTAVSAAAPGLAVSPSSLSFPDTQVGVRSGSVSVTVTNTGNAPLTVSSVITNSDFTQTNTCVGTPVVQGATCTVQVVFAPTAVGARAGVLTVYGNAPGGQATVQLAGNGLQAASVVLTPASATFLPTVVGQASAVQGITISNTGGTAATISSVTVSGDFAVKANTCGSSLASQTGCTVQVAFVPTAAGARTGALAVVDSAGTQTAALTGTGEAAATDSLTPGQLSFAATALNTASATQTVTLVNAGDVALTLIAAQVSSGDFTVVNGCGNSLNGHAQCVLTVGFAPKSLGQQAGVLQVSDQFRTQTVALSGLGVAPAGVSLAPVGGLGFGAVAVGTMSTVQTVTLTNNGGLTLQLAGIAVSGDFMLATGTNTCGATVAPGAACSFGVVFSPGVAGARSGVVTVTSNAAASPQAVALTGTGIDFALTANGLTTQTLTSGGMATYGLLVSSAAGVPGMVALTCTGAPAHATCSVTPVGPALGGTTLITVTVTTGVAASHGMELPWMVRHPEGWLALLVPLGLVGIKRRRWAGVLLTVLLGGAMLGCSTGRTIPGTGTSTTPAVPVTPSGTSTLVVSGTSAGLVRTVNLTLVVQ